MKFKTSVVQYGDMDYKINIPKDVAKELNLTPGKDIVVVIEVD